MFELHTFETILDRALNRVPTNVDKRQGSIIWDSIAPACAEIAQMYIELDNILKLTYAETSYGEWLDKRCGEMGVYREPATKAVRLGLMTGRNQVPMDIPIGSRFSIETVNYIASEKIETGRYKLICEQSGIVGNQLFGKLIPIETISGLVSAELSEVLVPGEEEETDKELYERYVEEINANPFGGNIDDYKQKIKAIQGVSDCKVFPAWQGGGTVKVTIIDTEYNKPSESLVATVQEIIDPIPYAQQGLGQAPIGHLVTITGVSEKLIDFHTVLTLKPSLEMSQMQTAVEEAINEYLLSLSMQWAKEEYLIVRISQIEAAVLNIDGIIDIEGTTLNGTRENIHLGIEEIPKAGLVSLN